MKNLSNEKHYNTSSIWSWMRVSFWAMIVFWVMASLTYTPEMDAAYIVLSFSACAMVIATFVLSIRHLRRYPEKGFAVTALVISSIGVLILALSFLAGLMIGLSG